MATDDDGDRLHGTHYDDNDNHDEHLIPCKVSSAEILEAVFRERDTLYTGKGRPYTARTTSSADSRRIT